MIARHNKANGESVDYECIDVEVKSGGFLVLSKQGSGYRPSMFVKMGDYDTLEFIHEQV